MTGEAASRHPFRAPFEAGWRLADDVHSTTEMERAFVRWLADPQIKANPTVAAVHVYLSTGCLHGEHEYCAAMTGMQGVKRPARCKFCDAQCRCECHDRKEPADDGRR